MSEKAAGKLFHWHGTWDEIHAEVARRWLESPATLEEFIEARLAEDNTGRHLDFTSRRALAAAWSDHKDYYPGWSPCAPGVPSEDAK